MVKFKMAMLGCGLVNYRFGFDGKSGLELLLQLYFRPCRKRIEQLLHQSPSLVCECPVRFWVKGFMYLLCCYEIILQELITNIFSLE